MKLIKLEIYYNKQCRADILKQVFEIFVNKENISMIDGVLTVYVSRDTADIIFNELGKQTWIDSYIISDLGPNE